jgi:hypothetical protein
MFVTTLDAIRKMFSPKSKELSPGFYESTVIAQNYQALIDDHRAFLNSGGFACPHCGCPKTMANVDKDNTPLPGRLCLKCATPVFVYTDFVDVDANWKHSKGPWKVVETKAGDITIESDTKIIATLHVDSIKKARFDSQLMATAPEILFWLNEVVELIDKKVSEADLKIAIVNALTTISKAERWAR